MKHSLLPLGVVAALAIGAPAYSQYIYLDVDHDGLGPGGVSTPACAGLTTGDVLSSANVDTAVATLPGNAPLALNWGAHGATTNRVWFWSSPWVIPATYPLGDLTVNVSYKTDDGKVGVYPYKLTIIA